MADRFYEDFKYSCNSRTNIGYYDEEDDDEDDEMGGYSGHPEVNDFKRNEKSEELACPFCSEDFDVLGLCCHIDADHRVEVKHGICPFCTRKVNINMASHVITQHRDVLKALRIEKCRSAHSSTRIFMLRKDMQDRHLRSIKESLCVESFSDSDPASDSKLLSFFNNSQLAQKRQTSEAAASAKASLSVESLKDDSLDRIQPTSSTERNNERASRCKFLQGLVFNTILDGL